MTGGGLRELLAIQAIRDVIGAYLEAADRGRSQALADLFAPGGVLEITGPTFDAGRYEGPDAILARLERSREDLSARTDVPLLRHHVSSVRIKLDPAAVAARADSYFLAITESGPDHWGRYQDRLALDEHGWRFVHRRVVHEGSREGSWLRRR